MKNDEFNKVKISNEKDGFSSVEFGKIQNVEFTFKNENTNSIKDEVNENKDFNSEQHRHLEKNNNSNKGAKNNQSDTIKNNLSSSTTSASSTTSSSAASVSSTAGVVASASVVTITTISTIVGINMYMNTKCNMNNLDVTPVSVNYDLELSDTNNDKVIINLENKEQNYLDSKELTEGQNIGSFDNLMPSSNYSLTVIDQTFNDYVVYKQEITTLEQLIKMNVGFSINPNLKYGDESFLIKLDYNDETNYMSDFKLHMFNNLKQEKIYPLIKTNKEQEVKLNKKEDEIKFNIASKKGFDYYVSYVVKEETINLESKHINFIIQEKYIIRMNYYEKANNKIALTLNMEEKQELSNPRILIYDILEEEYIETKNIRFTKEVQELVIPSIYEEKPYQYLFVCYNKNNKADELIDKGVFYPKYIERKTFISCDIHHNYFVIDNTPYLSVNMKYYDYDEEYGDLIFKYKIKGNNNYKEEKIKKINGAQYVPFAGNIEEREIELDKYQIISRTNKEEILYEKNNLLLERANKTIIFGGSIKTNVIKFNNPTLSLSLTHNCYNNIPFRDVKLFIVDTYPPTKYLSYSLNINDIDFRKEEIKVDLTKPEGYQERPYDYLEMLEYLKNRWVYIYVSYKINGSKLVYNTLIDEQAFMIVDEE